MSSCYGCTNSSKTTKGSLRYAQKIKSLEPSNLDQCMQCEFNPCTCESVLTIKASETVVENEMTVNGTICGDINGTFTGNVCLSLLKGSVQLVGNPDVADDIAVTTEDLITQVRTDAAGAYMGYIPSGSEGQLKTIELVAENAATSFEIYLNGINPSTITLSGPVAGQPTSVQLYFNNGDWYPYQTINSTI